MNWFRANPFWGAFAAIGGGALLVALGLLSYTRANFNDALSELQSAIDARQQLESSNPYPSEVNVRKMKDYLNNYRDLLKKTEAQLATHVIPTTALAPNEFQTRLQQSVASVAENARVNRVALPQNFRLGFDEFVSTLPTTDDAPRLGRELAQVQLLLNLIIDARVDAVSMFRRGVSAPAAKATSTPGGTLPATATVRAAASPKPIEKTVVEFTLTGPPSAVRRIINRIASAEDQFFIIRTLHVKNQKDKGPPREAPPAGSAAPASATTTPVLVNPPTPRPSSAPSGTPTAALNFIVGNEHLDFSARVELVDFAAP